MSTHSIMTCKLDNGLDLHCVDQSRKIAADRWYVCVLMQMTIPVEKKWFINQSLDDDRFLQIRSRLGNKIQYIKKKERNFVSDEKKQRIVDEICDGIRETAMKYLSHDEFAAKYILKRFNEPRYP